MKLFITGGTGLVGSHLIELLLKEDHSVTVLSRNIDKAKAILGNQPGFCDSLDKLHSLDGYDAVINLAGEPIADKRWSTAQKQRLCNSRWLITQQLARLINAGTNQPHTFISGSAIGYYGNKGDAVVTEDSPPHPEFTHTLCQQWEDFAMEAQSDKTRVCLLRTGIVLAPKGGMLSKLLPIFELGLGATMGSGKQYISWIHIDDMVRSIYFLLNTSHVSGAVNMTSPTPITNQQFSKSLAKALKRPCLFNVPTLAISLLMGEASTLIVDGQRAIPQKLESSGYVFRHSDIDRALGSICNGDKPSCNS